MTRLFPGARTPTHAHDRAAPSTSSSSGTRPLGDQRHRLRVGPGRRLRDPVLGGSRPRGGRAAPTCSCSATGRSWRRFACSSARSCPSTRRPATPSSLAERDDRADRRRPSRRVGSLRARGARRPTGVLEGPARGLPGRVGRADGRLLGRLPLRRRGRDRPRVRALQQLGRAAVRHAPTAARGRPARAHVLPPRAPALLRARAGRRARARRPRLRHRDARSAARRPARATSPRRSPTRCRRGRSASGSACPTRSGPISRTSPRSSSPPRRVAATIPPSARACNEKLYEYAQRLVRERIEHPRDPAIDIISGIYGCTDGTITVTEESCVELVRLLITAGHNSTTGGLGNSIMRIAADPEIQRRLRAEPELIPSAIEEFLRLETPVQSMPRWANEDDELHGREVGAGEQIMLFWAAANRDPEQFPDPDRCVLDRSPNQHVTFGRGIHRCIGIDLARLEIRVALEELLGRTELARARRRAGPDDLHPAGRLLPADPGRSRRERRLTRAAVARRPSARPRTSTRSRPRRSRASTRSSRRSAANARSPAATPGTGSGRCSATTTSSRRRGTRRCSRPACRTSSRSSPSRAGDRRFTSTRRSTRPTGAR